MTDVPRTRPARSGLRVVLTVIAVNVGLILLIEGLASALLISRESGDLWRPLEERAHTRHDSALGWTSEPDFSDPDLFGPGRGLSIGSAGFRRTGPDQTTASGKSQVVCSGGSLTFGPGVGDDATWCAALGRVDPRLSVVNMGQLGYGLDQSWLWYTRTGAMLEQDLHLLTVSTEDLERMRDRAWLSYDKPQLTLGAGRPTPTNVPVRQRSSLGVRMRGVMQLASNSRTAELARRLMDAESAPLAGAPDAAGADPVHPIVTAILDDLVAGHRERGSLVVLVYLPSRQDYGGRRSEPWRSFMRDAARDRLPFVDLVAELRTVPPADVDRYFLGADPGYRLAASMYSETGHEFLARALYRRLLTMPVIRARINAPDGR